MPLLSISPTITKGETNWKFLLIVVVLAAIVGGGTLWSLSKQEIKISEEEYQKKREELEQQFEEFKLGSTEIPSSKDFIEEETATWKVYTSQTMGFSVKYPPEWIIIREYTKEERFLKRFRGEGMFTRPITGVKGYLITFKEDLGYVLEIQKGDYYPSVFAGKEFAEEEKLAYQELIALEEENLKRYGWDKEIRKEKITLNDIPITRNTFLYTSPTVGIVTSLVYIPHEDGRIYRIYSKVGEIDEPERLNERLQTLNLMLSTFSFIE